MPDDMTMHRAIVHLRDRVEVIGAVETANRRPHWSRDDLAAVECLLRRNATDEVVALARIEGIATFGTFSEGDKLKHVHAIARRALGLKS